VCNEIGVGGAVALLASGAVIAGPSTLSVVRTGGLAAARFAIPADVGGFVMYHPYDCLGIELSLIAITLVVRGLIGSRRGVRPR
jgi:hypothetical protein